MTLFRPALLAPALLAFGLLSAAPTDAKTTPQEVWDLVQREVGPRLTAMANRRGDALILTRGRLELKGGVAVMLPDVTLREQPDGSVSVELPPRFPLLVKLPAGGRGPAEVVLNVALSDLQAVLRDIGPEDVDVSLSLGSVSAVMEPIAPTPGEMQPADLSAVLAGADLSLNWQSSNGTKGAQALADFTLGTLNLDLRVDVPSEKTKLTALADLSGLSAELDFLVPILVAKQMGPGGRPPEQDLSALFGFLDDGLKVKAKAKSGPLNLAVDGADPRNGPYSMSLRAGESGAEFGLDREAFLYDLGLVGAAMDFKGRMPDVPIDAFSLGAAEVRQSLYLDWPKAHRASPNWRVLYKFDGIALSDSLWNEADPQKIIPREPLALVLDASGTWTPDPRLTDRPGLKPGEMPLLAMTADLAELRVEGAGVQMRGDGALAFDFTDRSRYIEGSPVPEGQLSILTIGANALIDRLVAAKAIPESEMATMRMMLLLIGKAVSGKTDHLATELEFRGGSFILNGQKIR